MLIIGHRGAKGLAPENTLASLQAALDARVGMIEVDVRVTADGTPVLHHNSVMKTADGKSFHIEQTDFTDLQLANTDLLTLEAALQFIDRRTDMIIEIKPGQPIEPIGACIEPRLVATWLESDIILASFDFKLLQALHDKFPSLPIGICEKWSGVRAARRAKRLGTKRLIMNHRWLWGGFIKSMARQDYKISAYTINNPRRGRRLEKHGLYGCITDNPQLFLNNYTPEE